jgi:diguanylate cyclase (GGDEF)-like protein
VQALVRKAAPERERILHEYAAITCNRQTIPVKPGDFKKRPVGSITTVICKNNRRVSLSMKSFFKKHREVLEAEDLQGFSRSMAELQWLLLILVLLYHFIPTRPITNSDALIGIMVCYSASVIVFRYLKLLTRESRWKLAVETWLMIAFISLTLSHTGMVESPLLNLYLLVIIACAMTLGKIMTLLEVMLIAVCYLYMGFASYGEAIFSPETFTLLMAKFSPFLLVAYVTSMLAHDILAANKKITIMSQTDELTGLLNLRAFNLILDKEIARAARSGKAFTVLMLDVDSLKDINDHHGHIAGSRLLQAVANAINTSIRAADAVARYGGDEFVVLLTNTSAAEARIAAGRIRTTVNNTSFYHNGERIHTTVSIGVASFPEGVRHAEEVLEKADRALYNSKRSGRNRVSYYDSKLETVSAIA